MQLHTTYIIASTSRGFILVHQQLAHERVLYNRFSEALKAGNRDSIVAYNNGLRTPIYSITEYEDYTPGEIERDLPVAPGCLPDYSRLRNFERYLDGAQRALDEAYGWGLQWTRGRK